MIKTYHKVISTYMEDLNKGTKFDADKMQFSLLNVDFIEEMSLIMTTGVKKYAKNNWHTLTKERIANALIRHLFALIRGEKFDKESGYSHAAHIACNAMMLFGVEFCSKGFVNDYNQQSRYFTNPVKDAQETT